MPESSADKSGSNAKSDVTLRSTRRRKWLFRLFAVGLSLMSFVLLEAALRVMDIGRPTEYLDPYVGFSNLHSQFELDTDSGNYVTTQSRQMPFERQQFPAKKPKNGFRGFFLGGSTVRGRPYDPESAFSKWIEIELSAGDPQTKYRMVNCGGLSYASYRLTPILKEVLNYEPDLIVIATGQNEFLEDRTYQSIKQRSATRRWIEERVLSLRTVTMARKLVDSFRDSDKHSRPELPDKLEDRLTNPSGYASYHRDEAWRQQVITHYRHSLRTMVGMCRKAGVPVVLVRLDCNLRDCPPFKSEHKSGLSAEQERKWQQLFDDATAAEQKDLKRALKLYRQAEEIDGRHALLAFRIARVLDRLGRYDESRKYYIQAKEQDICPLRILSEMADDVKSVAKETGTPFVDARTMFRSRSPQGIPGNNLFVDHVHPTIGGHQLIAHAIVEVLSDRSLLPKTYQSCTPIQRRTAYRRHFDLLGASHLGEGKRRVSWVENWARRQRLLSETLPVDIRGRLDYGRRAMEFADDKSAWKEYWGVLKDSPSSYDWFLSYALNLFQQGRPGTAAVILDGLPPPLAEQSAYRFVFSRLVVALELKDDNTVRRLLVTSATLLEKVTADDPWRKVMPDAISRAKRIVAGSASK